MSSEIDLFEACREDDLTKAQNAVGNSCGFGALGVYEFHIGVYEQDAKMLNCESMNTAIKLATAQGASDDIWKEFAQGCKFKSVTKTIKIRIKSSRSS